jgi:hypothetical protein
MCTVYLRVVAAGVTLLLMVVMGMIRKHLRILTTTRQSGEIYVHALTSIYSRFLFLQNPVIL